MAKELETFYWAIDRQTESLVVLCVFKDRMGDGKDYISVCGYRGGNYTLDEFTLIRRISRPKGY